MENSAVRRLDAKTGWLIFALCWVVAALSVFGLRRAFIPAEELACFHNACVLDHAVKAWNKVNADKPMDEKGEIDEMALLSAGFLKAPLTYDLQMHYYFVDKKVHGLKVKCNKHEDNPLVLKATGVTLLAVLLFVVFCSFRGYVLWKD